MSKDYHVSDLYDAIGSSRGKSLSILVDLNRDGLTLGDIISDLCEIADRDRGPVVRKGAPGEPPTASTSSVWAFLCQCRRCGERYKTGAFCGSGYVDRAMVKYRQAGAAILSPDIYDGADGTLHRPRWMVDARGEKDDGAEMSQVVFSSDHFPAGTRIVVTVPVCPECDTDADLCDCGFDWREWTEERFS